jgi:NAD(P)-dependent dehydrogenase (short-subunit alcohol dehydrogenase family)
MAELQGQTVVVIGGSSGMGRETARRARAEGAEVIITGRDPRRLKEAEADVGARDSAAFDATDWAALGRFFDGLPATFDHIMVTAGGPYYAPLAELDHGRAVHDFDLHQWLPVAVAQHLNAVAPGVIETALHPPGATPADPLPPLGRLGQVSDIVDAILFLESAPYITGVILHVDGGVYAGQ